MSSNPLQLTGLTFRVLVFWCCSFSPAPLLAQNPASAPSRTPDAKISPSTAPTPKFTQEQLDGMISKLQERIRNAADQVMGRIQKGESDLYSRCSYFNKPTRLDPSTYASKQD